MIIGIAGGHRVGKTSLARQYAEKHDMQFIETSVGSIFKDLGIPVAARLSFEHRQRIQEETLKRLTAAYSAVDLKRGAIVDRTPIDLIAYTMADAVADFVPEEHQEWFADYVDKCYEVANKHLSCVIVVQPGIKIVDEGKSAVPNAAYIEHLNMLCRAAIAETKMTIPAWHLKRDTLSMEARLKAVESCSNAAVAKASEELRVFLEAKRLPN